MRSACSAMMPRKRSRAAASSRAGPRRVSMKPARPAIGVLSSWLALATKSARMRSARRSAVVSCSTIRASEPSAAARGRRRTWAITSSSGGPDSTNSTPVWSGPVKLPSAVSSSPSMAASSCGWRNTVERSRSAPAAPSETAGRQVGAHDAALAVDGDQRIGQAVDDRLGGGREIVDRGALAAPAGRELGRRRRQLLGGGREGEPRHDGLALVRQLADEAGEAGERAEIALDQQDRDHADAGDGDQRRPAGEVTRPVQRQQGDEGRRQRDGVGGDVAAERDRLVGHAAPPLRQRRGREEADGQQAVDEAADMGGPGDRLAARARRAAEDAEEDVERDPDAGDRKSDGRLPVLRISISTAPNTPLIAPDAPITGSTESG